MRRFTRRQFVTIGLGVAALKTKTTLTPQAHAQRPPAKFSTIVCRAKTLRWSESSKKLGQS